MAGKVSFFKNPSLMDELISLKAELNYIRSTGDRSNPYMKAVLEELYVEPEERLRLYIESILKKEMSEVERNHYARLLSII